MVSGVAAALEWAAAAAASTAADASTAAGPPTCRPYSPRHPHVRRTFASCILRHSMTSNICQPLDPPRRRNAF